MDICNLITNQPAVAVLFNKQTDENLKNLRVY